MTLPAGFRVDLAAGVLSAHGGSLLVGGSPLTALRLSPRARSLLSAQGITVTDAASGQVAARLLATNLGVPDLAAVAPAPAAELTVVIPVRDRPDQLDRTLAALAPLPCVVVDDASLDSDATERVTRRHSAELIRLAENAGPAGARNAGLDRVATPYVAFVDSDIEVSAEVLLALTRHFADPEVVLVGPRVVGQVHSARPRWFERYDAAASSLSLGRTPANVRPGAAVGWLPSACLVGRASALAGGFDAELRVGEDVDLVWRLVARGATVRYDPTAVALHEVRPTMRGWLGRKFVYGSGGAGLAARHGNALAPAVLSPTYAVAAAAVLARHRWSPLLAALALAAGSRAVHRGLPDVPDRGVVACRIATRGLGWAVRQESALLLRHWWPAAALAATRSRTVRKGLVTALAVDTVLAGTEQRHSDRLLAPGALLAGRRLDDLAYGAGLWWGAVKARSPRALAPRRPGPLERRRPERGDVER